MALDVLFLLASQLGFACCFATVSSGCDYLIMSAREAKPVRNVGNICLGLGVCTGDRVVNQDHWLVSACAAAGASSEAVLSKGFLQNLDPTAVIAIRLEKRRSKGVIAPTSGMALGASIFNDKCV